MEMTDLLEQYMSPLMEGRRAQCRTLVRSAIEQGVSARSLYNELLWPAIERVDRFYREDRIDQATEHLATRVNRAVADHLQPNLERCGPIGKRILITCANDEPEELAAQVCADLFEAEGWDVFLLGGGVPDDEILSLVGRLQPYILLIFGAKPTDAPGIRKLIDRLREVGPCPTMNIMVSGGVFNRAEGLWKEVQADLFARSSAEALERAAAAEPRKPEVRIPGAPKKRRRRRRPPLLVQAEAKV